MLHLGSKGGDSNNGAIIGGVVGAIALTIIAIVILIIFCVVYRKFRSQGMYII